jgi:hypothetical protein
LTKDLEEVIRDSEVVVLMEPLDSEMRKALRFFRPGQVCFDFVRTVTPEELPAGEYRALTFDPLAQTTSEASVA